MDEELRKYVEAASRERLLSPEEERALVVAAESGDQDAKERLVRANTRLVVSVAREYEGRGLPLVRLVHAGHDGLVRAVDRLDSSKDFRVASFAVWFIRQRITRALAEGGPR